ASDTPPTRTVPPSGVSKPPMMCASVDLPDPDGPVTATNSPAPMVTLTRSSAWIVSSPMRYRRMTSCSSMTTGIGVPPCSAMQSLGSAVAGRAGLAESRKREPAHRPHLDRPGHGTARYRNPGNGPPDLLIYLVGDTGIEPVTSSVSANVRQRRDQQEREEPQVAGWGCEQLRPVRVTFEAVRKDVLLPNCSPTMDTSTQSRVCSCRFHSRPSTF